MNKISKPKLLCHASRGGWETVDFYCVCDEKGATLTEVKSSEGYIFGGYSSASWASSGGWTESRDAFLFSLKCHAGLSAVRMNLIDSISSGAIYCGSWHGPSFGGRHDLDIQSNANNTKQNSFSVIGEDYSLPPGTTDPHFLTGQECFQVSEYEVFQV